ncbi:reverse transcriptase domain-containing protein [Alcanivorax sp. S71-1-4]|uniref:reverse transcriptase domain-containing protein n=1 Tax=Alcanivorax sp. S71-1-4 TaxID=1177159 RepID=UPI001358C1FC|nr:reverse transcriptase domain-containing protein [Alcanivorax sp. S71-1-4]
MDFSEFFSQENILSVFSMIKDKGASRGIDGQNLRGFEESLDSNVKLIHEKVLTGRYFFSRYKLKLISKGRGKPPREISIPTIRDRIVLKVLDLYLKENVPLGRFPRSPGSIVREFVSDVKELDGRAFIKADIKNYYPSINHNSLMLMLGKHPIDDRALRLIGEAISTPSTGLNESSSEKVRKGVPQGISISPYLADLYMSDVDRKISEKEAVLYYRYVDDILIFCEEGQHDNIEKALRKSVLPLGLSLHDSGGNGKFHKGIYPDQAVEFLGYRVHGRSISVRDSSIQKLRNKLISLFSSYSKSKKKNLKFLQWRLGLRITGCVWGGQLKGWLPYFSEINDIPLMYSLDNFVKKLIKRYVMESDSFKARSFVRAIYEVKSYDGRMGYITNFDSDITENSARILAVHTFDMDIAGMSGEEVVRMVRMIIAREISDMETDIGLLS